MVTYPGPWECWLFPSTYHFRIVTYAVNVGRFVTRGLIKTWDEFDTLSQSCVLIRLKIAYKKEVGNLFSLPLMMINCGFVFSSSTELRVTVCDAESFE